MSQDVQSHLSLLSLSIAAASAAPIPASPVADSALRSSQGVTTNTTKHRRLSSAGRSRRRLSDARDAATRPFPTSLQTTSASLAALSLSSPTVSHRPVHGAQPIQVPRATSTNGTSDPEHSSIDDTHLFMSPPQSHTPLASNIVNGAKPGRKRGTIFTCESCSKVYRHPSCLIKHRWEHTPQWREASKFVLSKHQQVQLLEAAAILSHLSPSSASLPEDRSLWPSFLSGGLVPPPAPGPNNDVQPTLAATVATLPAPLASNVPVAFPISSSVPASTILGSGPGSTGPRLHDYAIGVGVGGIGVTQVRPGVLGVQIPSMPAREDDALNLLALRSASVTSTSRSCGSPTPSLTRSRSHTHSHSHSLSYSHSLSASHASKGRERRRSNAYEYSFVSRSGLGYDYMPASARHAYAPNSNGGWSLPRSSIRSKSGSSGSQSRSASESRSDDEDDAVFGDVDAGIHLDGDIDISLEDGVDGAMVRTRVYESLVRTWKTEDGDVGVTEISVREDDEQEDIEDEKSLKRGVEQAWDGMEMEMEMD